MASSFPHIDQDPPAGGNIVDIDAKLIDSLQERNDRAAFTQLMNKYKKNVFGFCVSYTNNPDDAEDISQEIFIKVFKNIHSFKRKSKFSTWLYRITMNSCHDHSRWMKFKRMKESLRIPAGKKEEEVNQTEIKDDSGDPEKILLNKELGTEIRNAVAKLNVKQRAVLIMKDFQGRSYEQISEVMNMNLGTVKSTLSRGRMNVAKQIGHYVKQ